MDLDYWSRRWEEGQTGWHQREPNPALVAHHDALLAGERDARVLVPLAGKSMDVAWLESRGHAVIGVEGVEAAARAFFTDRGLTPHTTHDGPVRRLEAGRVEMIVANYFELAPAELGTFDAVFDRAALVAIHPSRRGEYAAQTLRVLRPGGRILLVTFAYDGTFEGPPFSVPEEEVRRHYATAAHIERLSATDIAGESPRFSDAGATFVREDVYLLTR